MTDRITSTFSGDLCKKLINSLYDGCYIVDRDRKILFWNDAAERISGFAAKDVLGKTCADNILTHMDADGNNLCLGACPLSAAMNDGNRREADVYMHHKNGHRIPVSVRVDILTAPDGSIIGGIELFTDIRHRQANELRLQEMEKLAMLDTLTHLANRRYIERELRSRMEEYKRFNVPFGVLFMDIDALKEINDTYGHAAGDAVLQYIAETLKTNTRPFDVYGRWGGDEFIGLIRIASSMDLEMLANRLLILFQNSYVIMDELKLSVTISMGATLVRENDTEPTILKRADDLLYQSKTAGRDRVTVG